LSPELCEEKPYNEKSDVWALGCVLYEMCTFKHPFDANNQGALVLKIIRGRYATIPSSYSRELSTLIDSCLSKDYRKRPSVRDILSLPTVVRKAQELNVNISSEARPTITKNIKLTGNSKTPTPGSADSTKDTNKSDKKQSDPKPTTEKVTLQPSSSAKLPIRKVDPKPLNSHNSDVRIHKKDVTPVRSGFSRVTGSGSEARLVSGLKADRRQSNIEREKEIDSRRAGLNVPNIRDMMNEKNKPKVNEWRRHSS